MADDTAQPVAPDPARPNLGTGRIGRLLGSRDEKPGNIAALVIGASFLCLMLLAALGYFVRPANEVPFDNLVQVFGTAIAGAMGFLFGNRGGAK
jgi:uncharacterized membrane protein (Fun14 family)